MPVELVKFIRQNSRILSLDLIFSEASEITITHNTHNNHVAND